MAEGIVEGSVPVTPATTGVVSHARVSWSAIFAGAAVTLGLWALLYLFGLAAGLSAMDPDNPSSAKAAGIGTGIWSAIAPLVALFVGSFITARLAGEIRRGTGALHGAVLWGASTVAGVAMVGSLLGSLLGGVTNLGAKGVSAAAGAAGSMDPAKLGQALGIDKEDLVAPVNQRLRAEGKPPLTTAQLQAVMQDVAGGALRGGDLDREALVASVARRTALDRRDAEEVADRMAAQWQQSKAQMGQQLQGVQTGALKAADATGKVLWGAFAALFLGLCASLAGGAVGARPTEGAGTTAPRRRAFPIGRPGEVHP